ncbi:hypothetical protein [Arthrobacter sp. STN4]|uniref:hypothetical protein n=1 Tax=Arthrobacter sp. STN4 TaxID=2923276 RepID=UPI00211A1009|nr:hypothetical protein [Arthrobacter sp. STN4]MCQ9162953.1 hypothetical protein [Arthrobacter sp. STN4]
MSATIETLALISASAAAIAELPAAIAAHETLASTTATADAVVEMLKAILVGAGLTEVLADLALDVISPTVR